MEATAPSTSHERPAAGIARRRRLLVAFAILVAATAILLLTAPRARLDGHTPYNHFALLAEAWLSGRLDLGGPPPAYTGNNDFALKDGLFFVSFPPFPALLLVPFVALAGGASGVRDGLVFVALSGVAPALLFLSLEELSLRGRSRLRQVENALLALLFAFGTVYWFSAVQGTVWFAAHVVGAALAALYLFASIGAARPLVAGIALGLGIATRAPLAFAAPLFLCEALRASATHPASARDGEHRLVTLVRRIEGRALLRSLGLFAAPLAVVGALLAWHNAARFDDPLEFGHRLLAIGWRARIERHGLFSYHYLAKNLAVALTSLPWVPGAAAPFQINAHGLALWVTSPFYALALWPRRMGATYWALAAAAGSVALTSLLYQNTGWIQFGYRFSNDYAVFLFAMLAVGSRRRLPRAFWVLGAAAVVVNGFGAMTFQRAGFERYYFLEPTQRVLHPPD